METLPIRALVLAGGLGKRLKPVISGTPKPLAGVGERTFLDILVDLLVKKGVRDFLMLTGYKGHMIEEHFKNRPRPGVRIDCLQEPEPLGTGGAVKNAEGLATDPTLIVYGDSYLDADLRDLLAFHLEKRGDVTMCLYPVPDVSRYGSVTINKEGRILGFSEKHQGPGGPGLINAGFYMVAKDFFGRLPEKRTFSMEADFFPNYVSQGRMFGMIVEAPFFDIGAPDSYRAFQEFATGENLG